MKAEAAASSKPVTVEATSRANGCINTPSPNQRMQFMFATINKQGTFHRLAMLTAAAMTRLLGLLALLLLVSGSDDTPSPPSQLSCLTIVADATPCLSFINGQAQKPSQPCCNGVKELAGLIKGKPDRQAACECLQQTLSRFTYDPSRIPQLSTKCGVSVEIPPISKDTNCKAEADRS